MIQAGETGAHQIVWMSSLGSFELINDFSGLGVRTGFDEQRACWNW